MEQLHLDYLSKVSRNQQDISLTSVILKTLKHLRHQQVAASLTERVNQLSLNNMTNDSTSAAVEGINEGQEGFYFVDIKKSIRGNYPNELLDHFQIESAMSNLYWAGILFTNKDFSRFSVQKLNS